ncbi:MAG: hypothetical protein ABFD49_07775 [Armatimonadota bacterium]|nr:hypothetical protein [bacterium]
MFSSAALEVTISNVFEKAAPGDVNFDLLYLAAEQGAIGMEEVGDIILANTGGFGRDAGVYTERQLDRKIRNERTRLSKSDIREEGISTDVTGYLFERHLDDLIDVSGLTAIQEICFRMCAAGLRRNNVADTLGLSPARTTYALRVAKRKIRRALGEGRYAGWYEVYLSEVNRTRKA